MSLLLKVHTKTVAQCVEFYYTYKKQVKIARNGILIFGPPDSLADKYAEAVVDVKVELSLCIFNKLKCHEVRCSRTLCVLKPVCVYIHSFILCTCQYHILKCLVIRQGSQQTKPAHAELNVDIKKEVSYDEQYSHQARVAQSLQAHDYVSVSPFSIFILLWLQGQEKTCRSDWC